MPNAFEGASVNTSQAEFLAYWPRQQRGMPYGSPG